MTNKQTFITLAAICLLMVFATSVSANATIGIGDGAGSVTIPIVVADSDNVGSMDVTLEYDPSIVNITGVENGEMDNTIVNLENLDDGWIRIVAYQGSETQMNETFVLVDVSFKPVADTGSCSLNITVKTFKDFTPNGTSMNYTVRNGTYSIEYTDADDVPSSRSSSGYKWYLYDEADAEVNVTDDEPSANMTIVETPAPPPTKNLPGEKPIDDAATQWWYFGVLAILAILVIAYLIGRKRE